MSKLQNFEDAKLENLELVEGAWRGDFNPFDGNGDYTPRRNNPYQENERLINKANRLGDRGRRKAERQARHLQGKINRQQSRLERKSRRNRH